MRVLVSIAAALALFALAACGSDEEAGPATTAPETTAPATTEEAPAETAPPTDTAGDPCSLVGDAELAGLFPTGAPEGEATDYGAGFSECVWASDEALLRISVVPEADLASDFLEQLNVSGVVDSPVLGEGAVSFPGVVGIGTASGGGATVGFVANGFGYLVAVRTGAEGDAEGDLATATSVAESIAGEP